MHLGLLLQDMFPQCKIQMTTIVINPKGTARYNEFSRVEEHAFFVFFGDVEIQQIGSDMLTTRNYATETHVRWRGLARTGRKGLRPNNPGSWYPIFLNELDDTIHSIGDPLTLEDSETDVRPPKGTYAVWPPSNGDLQYSWGTIPETLRDIHEKGGLKTGRVDREKGQYPFYYVSAGLFAKIDTGEIVVTGLEIKMNYYLSMVRGKNLLHQEAFGIELLMMPEVTARAFFRKYFQTQDFPFLKAFMRYSTASGFLPRTNHKPKSLISSRGVARRSTR